MPVVLKGIKFIQEPGASDKKPFQLPDGLGVFQGLILDDKQGVQVAVPGVVHGGQAAVDVGVDQVGLEFFSHIALKAVNRLKI